MKLQSANEKEGEKKKRERERDGNNFKGKIEKDSVDMRSMKTQKMWSETDISSGSRVEIVVVAVAVAVAE